MIAEIIAAVHLTAISIFGIEVEMQTVRCTCYLPTGNCTASGVMPYEGIIASNRSHLGDMCLIFDMDGNFIEMMECRDVGGHRKLRNGSAIDVFRNDMESAKEWIRTYGDYVQIIWIPAEG